MAEPSASMTEPSESEIIKSNPIGDGLNAFHKSFESIRAEQGISVPEAVQHVVNEGKVEHRKSEALTNDRRHPRPGVQPHTYTGNSSST